MNKKPNIDSQEKVDPSQIKIKKLVKQALQRD